MTYDLKLLTNRVWSASKNGECLKTWVFLESVPRIDIDYYKRQSDYPEGTLIINDKRKWHSICGWWLEDSETGRVKVHEPDNCFYFDIVSLTHSQLVIDREGGKPVRETFTSAAIPKYLWMF